MKIEFDFPAHVINDLKVIREDIFQKEKRRLPFYAIIVSLIKELRERIEFERLNKSEP